MTTLSRRIEAILFTRDEAVSEALLAQALDVSEDAIRAALLVLEARYEASAMMLVRLAGGWRLQLRPAFFPAVAAFAEAQPARFPAPFGRRWRLSRIISRSHAPRLTRCAV